MSNPTICNTECIIFPISGYTPKSAITVNAMIIAFSTAIGQISKDKFDPDGSSSGSAFFVYLFVVFITAFLIHTILLFFFKFGGGMLADKNTPIDSTLQFWWSGNRSDNIYKIGPYKLMSDNITSSEF